MKVLSLILLLWMSNVSAEAQRIVVASEIYPGYVNADKSGMYIDILEDVYPNANIEVIITTYERAIRLVKAKKADLWLGAYLNERKFALYPKLHMDQDKLVLAYMEDQSWQGINTTSGKKIAWVTGYSMGKYINTEFEKYLVSDINTAIKMLRAKRVDFVIEDYVQLKNSQAFDKDINVHIFKRIPLYPGFVNSAKGKQLVHTWDKGMQRIIENGTLKSYFDNDPDSEYPYL